MLKPIQTPAAPAAIGPYSQAVEANGFLFCSGQIALDPEKGDLTGETVGEQSKQVLQNLKAVLAAAELDWSNVIKTTIYLINMDDFAEVNSIYEEALGEAKPARATVAVSELPKGAKIEMDLIAAR
jgi:2-iminobutanoate/2-iminopropanoate deaminase